MDYNAELRRWMSEHMLTPLDVADILKEIRHEDIEERAEDSRVSDIDDSMDGDFDSAMASAGHGTDEDYGYFGDPEVCGE